jgi:hypothetical protein
MTLETVLDQNRARPFRPFIIHMADGRKFVVEHPEFMAKTGQRTVLLGRSDNDGFDVLDVMLMTSIEVLDSQRKRNGDGRGEAA